jgi:Lrp/AsnC family leucine-responsive transcriptional regulator
VAIDDLDRRILDVVQRDNQQSADAVGREVGLSPSAVQRRLKRLRETKVIERDVAVVAPEAAGRGFLVIANVIMESESAQLRRQFARIARETPEVMQCYYVTGEATDFFLLIAARDMNDYNDVMARIGEQFPKIKRFSTNVVLERIKSSAPLPLR